VKIMENRLARLEQRIGSRVVLLRVLEDRGRDGQVDDGHGMTKEEMDAAVARYRQEHPHDQGTNGLLVLYFERDGDSVVQAGSQRDKPGERQDSKHEYT